MFTQKEFQDGDATLIRRAAAGQRSAFDLLVERHQAAVYRFACSLARDEAAAEEALQETFLSAFKSTRRFRGEASARAWLLTIVRHVVERQLVRKLGEPAESQALGEIGRAAGWGAIDDHLADRLADHLLLQRALAGLSSADRALLILRDLEGLTSAEAAEVMGIAESALKTRLHRARLRLLAGLRREVADGG
jgi:RNA polymerase sigma-70 factor (ECF subfamily)